jgi:LEA14-like dessication related protein
MPFCTKCGFEHEEGDKFCNKCGVALSDVEKPTHLNIPVKKEESKPIEKKERNGSHSSLVIIFIIVLIVGAFYAITQYQQRAALKNVDISPSGFRVINLGFTSATIEIDFTGHNRGDITATLDSIDYQVYVNDVFLLDGTIPKRYDIRPNQRRTITTKTSVSYLNIGRGVLEAITSSNTEVRVVGTAHIETPIGTFDVPFAKVV